MARAVRCIRLRQGWRITFDNCWRHVAARDHQSSELDRAKEDGPRRLVASGSEAREPRRRVGILQVLFIAATSTWRRRGAVPFPVGGRQPGASRVSSFRGCPRTPPGRGSRASNQIFFGWPVAARPFFRSFRLMWRKNFRIVVPLDARTGLDVGSVRSASSRPGARPCGARAAPGCPRNDCG